MFAKKFLFFSPAVVTVAAFEFPVVKSSTQKKATLYNVKMNNTPDAYGNHQYLPHYIEEQQLL